MKRPFTVQWRGSSNHRYSAAPNEGNEEATMTEVSFARFRGQVALISGAGNGICRSSAEIIAAEGGTIAAVDNNQEALDDAMAAFAAAGGGEHQAYCANALAQEEVEEVVADVVDRYGRIDILINGVGGSTIIDDAGATVDELTMEEWQKLLDFNLSGTFLFCHAVVPHMTRHGGGKIVNFASIAGRGKSATSSTAYSAAKGGIIAFTTKLALEVGPAGINVNAIAPSATLAGNSASACAITTVLAPRSASALSADCV